ncbi:MAG: (Fe-S)-binding protein [Armatimonadota bacterium]|nr:(Fe-S)-binding protein [Armatimonadota bacterium]MDR5703853.1 (Fe-S)-binding protein [Armatimonadota bacterium]MDR7435497.1 (Fe-S)-binding protein [Armatimonadota bacterium]
MRVSLFVTCLVDQLFPQVGEATVEVLHRVGVEVDFPEDQTCCGQPAFNDGFWPQAREVAKQFLRAFSRSEVIVAPSGSCVAMVREYYPLLFQEEPRLLEQARELGERTYELSEFLVRVLQVEDVGASLRRKATYHASCHGLRALGLREEPLRLLRNVRGLELVDLPGWDECCGFGGVFSVKMPHLSAAMLEEKIRNIVSTGAEVVVATDVSCLMHIAGGLRRRKLPIQPMHLAEVLASTAG